MDFGLFCLTRFLLCMINSMELRRSWGYTALGKLYELTFEKFLIIQEEPR